MTTLAAIAEWIEILGKRAPCKLSRRVWIPEKFCDNGIVLRRCAYYLSAKRPRPLVCFFTVPTRDFFVQCEKRSSPPFLPSEVEIF